ncbi:MAG: ABC transporter permease [Chloroflexi bacterium]|nr:ABC transporter permease [Chloroflexota bacterium]
MAVAAPAINSRSAPAQRRVQRQQQPSRTGLDLWQALPSALEALRANKSRSILTALGIIIGVAAVIAIVSLGQGSTAQVTSQLSSLGTNILTVTPGSTSSSGIAGGAGTSSSLKESDATAIASQVDGIKAISATVSGSAQIIAGGENWQTRVTAVEPAYQQINNWQVAQGAFFTEADDTAAKNVAVIGNTVATELFPNGESAVGQQIRIRNVPFTVVGVLTSKGSGMGGDQDDTVLIPFKAGQIRLFGSTSISSVLIQASSEDQMSTMSEEITTLLRSRHRIETGDDDDFSIRNNSDLLKTMGSISSTLTYLLGGVAGVSLLVGGIGIMNIMLVSVTERTREIGIRLAIGARDTDILAQFLIEALVLALLGGIVGIVLGAGIAFVVTRVLGWALTVSATAVAVSFGFSALVGIGFGVYPARKASRLNPIEALRFQ